MYLKAREEEKNMEVTEESIKQAAKSYSLLDFVIFLYFFYIAKLEWLVEGPINSDRILAGIMLILTFGFFMISAPITFISGARSFLDIFFGIVVGFGSLAIAVYSLFYISEKKNLID